MTSGGLEADRCGGKTQQVCGRRPAHRRRTTHHTGSLFENHLWAVQLMRGKQQVGSVAVREKGCGLAEAPQKGRGWEWRVKRRRMIPCARAPSMTTLKGL